MTSGSLFFRHSFINAFYTFDTQIETLDHCTINFGGRRKLNTRKLNTRKLNTRKSKNNKSIKNKSRKHR